MSALTIGASSQGTQQCLYDWIRAFGFDARSTQLWLNRTGCPRARRAHESCPACTGSDPRFNADPTPAR